MHEWHKDVDFASAAWICLLFHLRHFSSDDDQEDEQEVIDHDVDDDGDGEKNDINDGRRCCKLERLIIVLPSFLSHAPYPDPLVDNALLLEYFEDYS